MKSILQKFKMARVTALDALHVLEERGVVTHRLLPNETDYYGSMHKRGRNAFEYYRRD
jgi:hypothetical protein